MAEKFTLDAMDTVHAAENVPPNDALGDHKFHLIALVLARADITSVAELAGSEIATDGRHLSSNREVRTALVAAGASGIQIRNEGPNVIERLVNGQVSAAILTLVSQDAAKAFPNIAGFKLFEIRCRHLPCKGRSPAIEGGDCTRRGHSNVVSRVARSRYRAIGISPNITPFCRVLR
jgi:hypothetical protein